MKKGFYINLVLLSLGVVITFFLKYPPEFVLNYFNINPLDFAGTTFISPLGDSYLLNALFIGIIFILLRYVLIYAKRIFKKFL